MIATIVVFIVLMVLPAILTAGVAYQEGIALEKQRLRLEAEAQARHAELQRMEAERQYWEAELQRLRADR